MNICKPSNISKTKNIDNNLWIAVLDLDGVKFAKENVSFLPTDGKFVFFNLYSSIIWRKECLILFSWIQQTLHVQLVRTSYLEVSNWHPFFLCFKSVDAHYQCILWCLIYRLSLYLFIWHHIFHTTTVSWSII